MSGSAVVKSGAIASAQVPLDALEGDLWAEEARLMEERLSLGEGWRQVNVAVKLGRLQDEAVWQKCGKIPKDAKEFFERALEDNEAAEQRRDNAEAREKVLQEQAELRGQGLWTREEAAEAREV